MRNAGSGERGRLRTPSNEPQTWFERGKAHRWAIVSPFGPHEIVGMESEQAGNRQFRRAPRRLQHHWRQVLKFTEFEGNLNQTVV